MPTAVLDDDLGQIRGDEDYEERRRLARHGNAAVARSAAVLSGEIVRSIWKIGSGLRTAQSD